MPSSPSTHPASADDPSAGTSAQDTAPRESARSDQLALLQQILDERMLEAHFQPILDFHSGEIVGHEGLIRGPLDTPLRAPIDLFRAANKHGLILRLERLCRQTVIERFAALGLDGTLFLNVRPQCLALPGVGTAGTRELLKRLDIHPERIVIELTENLPIFDFASVRAALTTYRSVGFKVAIDDLGEGFASFRLWSELQPEYVKADMHFVQGIDRDPLKLQFLKSIQQLAEACGSLIIAEGIETEAELAVVRDLGVPFGQGYLIGRPGAQPSQQVPEAVLRVLRQKAIAVYPAQATSRTPVTAEALLIEVEPVRATTAAAEVLQRFEREPSLHAVPVVEDGVPIGLIERYAFLERFVRPYWRELFGRKSCRGFIDAEPLVVDKHITIEELSTRLAEAERRYLAEGFILTDNGRYAGLGTGQDLVREITRLQIHAARYANPLTLLPGNVPIDEHMDRLLGSQARFAVCHCDLDHFKPFNDRYGYRRGDDMLQLAARILAGACDPHLDFLGHVGGDDFVLLMQSADWPARCERALARFERESRALYAREDLERGALVGEDRQGHEVVHPLSALSIGAVVAEPGAFASHYEVSTAAAEAKRQAKRQPGNTLFIERRRPAGTDTTHP